MTDKPLSKAQIWLLAIRPKTLPASLSPVVIGIAFAYHYGKFRFDTSIVALIDAVLLQILSNLANDYFDFVKGYDSGKRIGPTRVAASGLLSPEELRRGMSVNVLAIIITGLYLIYSTQQAEYYGINGSLIVLGIGIFSLLCAFMYSGGPFPLSVIGLGDLFVLIFFGVVAVNGTFFVNTGFFAFPVLIASLAPGLLITAILVVNNYRDHESDQRVGKNTMIVMFGKRFGEWEYTLSVILAYMVVLFFFLEYPEYGLATLLPFTTMPLGWRLVQKMNEKTPPCELNELLAKTAKLSLFFSLALALGIAI